MPAPRRACAARRHAPWRAPGVPRYRSSPPGSRLARAEGALHLVAQIGPDLAIERGEFGVEADLDDIARARQRDVIVALDAPRPGGHHHHAVGERDRLFEVMG